MKKLIQWVSILSVYFFGVLGIAGVWLAILAFVGLQFEAGVLCAVAGVVNTFFAWSLAKTIAREEETESKEGGWPGGPSCV